jgi:hypothetical protein
MLPTNATQKTPVGLQIWEINAVSESVRAYAAQALRTSCGNPMRRSSRTRENSSASNLPYDEGVEIQAVWRGQRHSAPKLAVLITDLRHSETVSLLTRPRTNLRSPRDEEHTIAMHDPSMRAHAHAARARTSPAVVSTVEI